MIERKKSPFPYQLKPNRSDSWAIVFHGDLISRYDLYDPTHGKASLVDGKFYNSTNMLQS